MGSRVSGSRSRDTRDIVVGIASLGALVLAVIFLAGDGYREAGVSSGYRVKAVFNRIDGLFPGDTVTLSGIPVGVVEKTHLDPRFRAVVALRIDNAIPLPDDTSIAIHTDGLFGSKFIVLEPGGSDDLLGEGDAISYAQDSMIVTELLDLIIAEGKSARARSAAE